jgi:two-component system CheB/CheR fusion protein
VIERGFAWPSNFRRLAKDWKNLSRPARTVRAGPRSGFDNRVPVVGLGASAGGIEAFNKFFENMSPRNGLAFVVVLHLPTDRKSILPELLS